MCISFQTTGQIPIPSIPPVDVPGAAAHQSDMNPMATNEEEPENDVTPIIKSLEFWDSNGCQVDEVPEDGIVTLVAETEGFNEGDPVTFTIEGAGTFTGYVETDEKAYARNCNLSLLKEAEGGEK